nr:DALR anticodon-binding domain-containing protein [Candidatus Venteria ishoeyi]
MPRVRAAMTALGAEADKLTVLLVQFASLWRGKEKLQMSTRSGEFVTLRELRKEVGKDAARFFYVLRKSEQHMDFDLELAKSRSNDNPVYYIQYAHARVSSVFRQLQARNLVWLHDPAALESLNNEYEQALLTRLSKYGNVVETAAKAYEPHQIAYYLRELANEFHTFYNAHQFIVEDEDVRNARLSLIEAVQQVLRNGLAILGVSAPDEM